MGEKILNVNCIGFPAFGQSGPFASPYYMRFPTRMNHDISLFKNFPIGKGSKKLQFRVGFFNIFNQAAPEPDHGGQDVDLTLQTTCNVRVNGVPNGTGARPTTSATRRGASPSPRTRSTTSARSSCSGASG